MSRSSRGEAKESATTFVDRYWEWRRLRALRAQGSTRALEAVVEALTERRGVARRPGGRGRASPVGRSSEARDRSGHDPSRPTRESPRGFEHDRPEKRPSLRAEGDERTGANGPRYSTILVAVDGVKKMADRSGVGYEERLILGRPWEVIVGVAGKTGADCIVVGSSRTSLLPQTSPVDRAPTGGTRRRVIRHAKRPVLIV